MLPVTTITYSKPNLIKWPNIKGNFSAALLISVVICLCLFIHQPSYGVQLEKTEQFKVIQLEGRRFPWLLNSAIQQYSLMAVQDGYLKAIPYQFDEYDAVGNVYFEQSGVPLLGSIDVLDPNDRLLFLLNDAGPRKSADQMSDGEIVAEITLQTKSGEPLYAYIVKNSRLRSDVYHVRYSKDISRAETDFYSIINNKKNALIWDEFKSYTFTGDQESPLDSLKFRAKGGMLLPFPKLTLNNKNFIAKPYEERIGPIRATTQFRVTMKFLGIPLLKFDMQVYYFPKYFTYSARVKVPRLQRLALYKPQMTMSLDGNDLEGAIIETPLVNGQGVVDGKLSEVEKEIIDHGIDNQHTWIRVNTGKNLDSMALFEYIEELNIPIKVHLVDNKTKIDKPEKYPGQSPDVGYLVTSIPRQGFVGMRVSLFLDDEWADDSAQVAKDLTTPPEITIKEYQETTN